MSLMCDVTAHGASASTVSIGSSSKAMLLPVSTQTPTCSLPIRFRIGDQLVGAEVLVVLDRQPDPVPGRDRLGHRQRAGRRVGGASEGVGGREHLVPPPAEHHRADHGRAGPRRGPDLGLEPIQVVAVSREADGPLQVHPVSGRPLAQEVARGVVARPDADLHAARPSAWA